MVSTIDIYTIWNTQKFNSLFYNIFIGVLQLVEISPICTASRFLISWPLSCRILQHQRHKGIIKRQKYFDVELMFYFLSCYKQGNYRRSGKCVAEIQLTRLQQLAVVQKPHRIIYNNQDFLFNLSIKLSYRELSLTLTGGKPYRCILWDKKLTRGETKIIILV